MPKVFPYINHFYNMYINGVDVLDQLVASYDRQHRYKNWKMQSYNTAWSIIGVLSYQMYKWHCSELGKQPMKHFDFKQELAVSLLRRESPRQNQTSQLSSAIDLIPDCVLHPYHRME